MYLSNIENIKIIADFVIEKKYLLSDVQPCTNAPNGSICTACDPTASTNSIDYVDLSDLPENWTIRCEKNPSFLYSLVNIGAGIGHDLFGGLYSGVAGFLSKFSKYAIWAALALVVAIVLGVFFRFRGQRTVVAVDKEPLVKNYKDDEDIDNEPYATAT